MINIKRNEDKKVLYNPAIGGICPLEYISPETEKEKRNKKVIDPLDFVESKKEEAAMKDVFSEIIEDNGKHLDESVSPIFFTEDKIGNLANYFVVPIRKIIYINRAGNPIKEREKIICEIYFDTGRLEKFTILTQNIKKLAVIIGDEFSDANINIGFASGARILEKFFRNATAKIPVIRCYVEQGWQKIDGRRVYVHDNLVADNIIFKSGKTLPFYQYLQSSVSDIFIDAYNLYLHKPAIATMLAFAFLGVLYELFEEAGYAPRFLLFINGRTGSMKTTLSKILFIQLADDAHREMPRRFDADTVTSFERGIVLGGRDTVTVIDDYAPAKTVKQRYDNEKKLESLVRMVGDRSTKSRSNVSLEDCRGEGVHGGVVLTGELVGKGLSSNLRCFYCGIKREHVNVDMVSKFQDEPYYFTTLIQHFVYFAGAEWIRIVKFIHDTFPDERKNVRKAISEYRLIDSTVTLRLICDLLSVFLQEYCGIAALDVKNIVDEMKNGILEMASISESISKEESIAMKAVKIIGQLLQNEKLKLIKRRPNKNEIMYIDGFYESEFYYFLPQNLYENVYRSFSLANIYMPFNQDELIKLLYEEGIIISSSNGAGKKTYYARIQVEKGKKIKFIKIRQKTIEEIVND